MPNLLYVIIGLYITFSFIGLSYGLYYYIKTKKEVNSYKEKYKEIALKEFENSYKERKKVLDDDITRAKGILNTIKKEIEDKKDFNSSLLKIREEELNRLMAEKKARALSNLQHEIDDWAQSAQEAAAFQRDQIFEIYQSDIDKKNKELSSLRSEIEEYRAKRNVINEEILRARAVEEQQDFYRIQIPDSYKEDIHYLISITDRFHNKEIIYKLIWSEYLQKPFKTMLNHVLNNREPKNVIYMIQNVKSKEIYIGKTKAEVSKRWTEHIKTSLNIGTISRSNIHKALFNHWDDFTFSILEEVPLNSNLNEREKFYISFYQSDIYGYNIKAGG